MDLLFKRYASPFLILNGYIQTCRFCEFIDNFAEAVQETDRYEMYLHKVWDKSYSEFKEDIQTTQKNRHMSNIGFETTIKNSMNILNNFNPEQNGGE
ncbi:MAG: hypothetical protein J6Q39_08335 [Bacteroidales bacterium]|nr:hypothetical protein [Bacteroidales bacterium]